MWAPAELLRRAGARDVDSEDPAGLPGGTGAGGEGGREDQETRGF